MLTYLMQMHKLCHQDIESIVQNSIGYSISGVLSHHTMEMLFISAGTDQGSQSNKRTFVLQNNNETCATAVGGCHVSFQQEYLYLYNKIIMPGAASRKFFCTYGS
jgi:hypothetical protein